MASDCQHLYPTYALVVPLTAADWDLVEKAAANVPPPERPPAIGTDADYPDFVTNPQLTVLDLQLHNVTVNNAIEHFRKKRWREIRTMDDLEAVLRVFPPTRTGTELLQPTCGFTSTAGSRRRCPGLGATTLNGVRPPPRTIWQRPQEDNEN